MTFRPRMVGVTVSVTEKVKQNLDRQARERGISLSVWTGQLFDAAFAAACAREKSMPISDGDLDAIVGATLLLRAREQWDTATIAQALSVSEPTVVRILQLWKDYRVGMEASSQQAARLEEALQK